MGVDGFGSRWFWDELFKCDRQFVEVGVAFDASEVLFDFSQAGGAPAFFQGAIAPLLDSASHRASGIQRGLDGVGARQALTQSFREAQLQHRECFLQALAQAGGGVRVDATQPFRSLRQLLQGRFVIVAVVREAQAAVEFGVMGLSHVFFHVAFLVDLAALNEHAIAPDFPNRTGQRLGAIQIRGRSTACFWPAIMTTPG